MYKSVKQKSSNKNIILECIFRNSPISRTAISELTGITPASVTTVTAKLIEDGMIYEEGKEDTDSLASGRKRITLNICADYLYSVGVSFDPNFLCICITDLHGTVCYSETFKFTPELSAHLTDSIIEGILSVLQKAELSLSRIAGIGIALPGHIDKSNSRIISNNNIWGDFNVQKIRNAFDVPVLFENDVRCMALSQYLFHAADTPDSFSYFHVGPGIFCATVTNEQLFLGNAYFSGEIGHTIVNPNGPQCGCGKQGCLQTTSSETWLIQNARSLYKYDSCSLLRHLVSSPDEITIDTIATAYIMGDEGILQYMSNALRYIGITLSNIAILMDPKKIFLHGKMFTYPEIYSKLRQDITSSLNFVETDTPMEITPLPFDVTDGAVGGAALAIIEGLLEISYH